MQGCLGQKALFLFKASLLFTYKNEMCKELDIIVICIFQLFAGRNLQKLSSSCLDILVPSPIFVPRQLCLKDLPCHIFLLEPFSSDSWYIVSFVTFVSLSSFWTNFISTPMLICLSHRWLNATSKLPWFTAKTFLLEMDLKGPLIIF